MSALLATPAVSAPQTIQNAPKRRRFHAKMPGDVSAIFDATPWRHRAFCPLELRQMLKRAYSLCGRSRSYGWVTHAQMMDLGFARLTRFGRALDPSIDADVRHVNRAIALLHNTLPAMLKTDTGYKLRGFSLESGSEKLTAGDMAKERRRLLSRRRATKKMARLREKQKCLWEKASRAHIPGDLRNVASYGISCLTGCGFAGIRSSRPRAASQPQSSTAPPSPIAAKPDALPSSEVGCTDIEQINLLEKGANRCGVSEGDGSQVRSVPAVAAPAAAPGGAPGDLGVASPLSAGVQTPNTTGTAPQMTLEERLAAACARAEASEDLDEEPAGQSSAEYTQAVHDEELGGVNGQLRPTPRHAGLPTVPVVAGRILTPRFMARFKATYPEFASLNGAPLAREGLTETHLWAAAHNTRRAKSKDRRPGMLVHGARMMRDGLWGINVC